MQDTAAKCRESLATASHDARAEGGHARPGKRASGADTSSQHAVTRPRSPPTRRTATVVDDFLDRVAVGVVSRDPEEQTRNEAGGPLRTPHPTVHSVLCAFLLCRL